MALFDTVSRLAPARRLLLQVALSFCVVEQAMAEQSATPPPPAGPSTAEQDAQIRAESAAQAAREMKTFSGRHPEWPKYEQMMIDWSLNLKPDKLNAQTYLDVMYFLARKDEYDAAFAARLQASDQPIRSHSVVYGSGVGVSCGTWWAERRDVVLHADATQWVLGFLSGVSASGPVLKQSDHNAIELWIDNYCQANPLDKLATAAAKLVLVLRLP
jgi:hypothetical protein